MLEAKNITAAPIHPSHFKLSEQSSNKWVAIATLGTKRSDLLMPTYWSHVAVKLHPWDSIEVRAEDGSYRGEYVVRNSDRTWARVHEISFIVFESPKITQDEFLKIRDEYDIKLRGSKGWTVIRRSGNTMLQENMHSREDAEVWLHKFLESQNVLAAA
jgi:hypothetical protein